MADIPLVLTLAACCCVVLLVYCVFLLRRIDRGVEAVRVLLYHDYDCETGREGIYAEPDTVSAQSRARRSA